ncbi:MAG: 5-formyltetrahydrofolate cyclo-ligase [Pseudomonadota bacterium]
MDDQTSMPAVNTQAMKQALRQRIIAARRELVESERLRLNEAIVGGLLRLESYRSASTVLAYMNFGTEFAAEKLARQALQDGKQLLLPKVNPATKELDIYRVTDLQQDLAPGPWQIREPLAQRCILVSVLHEVDFMLLPGVAFGRDGARLGYGGGYYDKLLARMSAQDSSHRPALVAGAYAMQIITGIPQDSNDRKVEWLVSENETLACAVADI